MAAPEKTTRTYDLQVPPDAASERLDRYLGSLAELNLSRTRIQKLISDGLVTVDGRRVSKKLLLSGGEAVTVTVPPPSATDIVAEDIPLDIVFEDGHLVVINKPAGMVTHPGAGNFSGTLVNALMYHVKDLASGSAVDRPGIVHRLDKNTSGLLLVAKSDTAYQQLQKAIQKREVKRTYLALVCGHVAEDSGVIDRPIGRSIKDRKKMAVTTVASREAVTQFQRLERFRSYDLLEVGLLTGRTHQIRVHFSHLGHPVFGDPEYGGRHKWVRGLFAPERPLARKMLEIIDHQALHARRLDFDHPVTGERIELEVGLPADFDGLMELLKQEGM